MWLRCYGRTDVASSYDGRVHRDHVVAVVAVPVTGAFRIEAMTLDAPRYVLTEQYSDPTTETDALAKIDELLLNGS